MPNANVRGSGWFCTATVAVTVPIAGSGAEAGDGVREVGEDGETGVAAGPHAATSSPVRQSAANTFRDGIERVVRKARPVVRSAVSSPARPAEQSDYSCGCRCEYSPNTFPAGSLIAPVSVLSPTSFGPYSFWPPSCSALANAASMSGTLA